MTAHERAYDLLNRLNEPGWGDELTKDFAEVIEAAVKEAIEVQAAAHRKVLLHMDETEQFWKAEHGRVCQSFQDVLAIARELAAKHIRGTKACTACGAAAYMGTLVHNEGCVVKKLEDFR